MLLGVRLIVTITEGDDEGADPGAIVAQRTDHTALHQDERDGLIRVCPGTPTREVLPIREADERDRPAIVVGAIAVRTSAPRVIENFLDLGHLGYVHAGYLGDDPATQVLPYKVDPLPGGGIVATQCRMYQPQASPAATKGFVVDYGYRRHFPAHGQHRSLGEPKLALSRVSEKTLNGKIPAQLSHIFTMLRHNQFVNGTGWSGEPHQTGTCPRKGANFLWMCCAAQISVQRPIPDLKTSTGTLEMVPTT